MVRTIRKPRHKAEEDSGFMRIMAFAFMIAVGFFVALMALRWAALRLEARLEVVEVPTYSAQWYLYLLGPAVLVLLFLIGGRSIRGGVVGMVLGGALGLYMAIQMPDTLKSAEAAVGLEGVIVPLVGYEPILAENEGLAAITQFVRPANAGGSE